MATDGDKIAAATLTAKLIDILPNPAMVSEKVPKALELYGEILSQLARINPESGKPFTPEEIRQKRFR
jgi:hypothetical protein